MKFRKKPVVIEAIQFIGTNTQEIATFLGENGFDPLKDIPSWVIQTLEGSMKADIGDWIIKSVKGEFYPCKPDIFEATYEDPETKDTEIEQLKQEVASLELIIESDE